MPPVIFTSTVFGLLQSFGLMNQSSVVTNLKYAIFSRVQAVQPPILAIAHIAQIWGPNTNNNIYILTHEYSSTGFE